MNFYSNISIKVIPVISLLLFICGNIDVKSQDIESWITEADRSMKLKHQEDKISFGDEKGRGLPIIIDERQEYQEIDGFGFALTEGSAFHLNHMTDQARERILRELFGTNSGEIGISYIRLTIGASDLNHFVYSYDDLKEGQIDPEMRNFDLGQDRADIIPITKEILKISPEIKILASPWSAPKWMKEGGDVRGGALKKEFYKAYAIYFTKYIQEMAKEGINIDAVTVQNEPLNSRNTPSMPWSWQQQNEFVRDFLGPAFESANIKTKILIFDHNCDRADYPLSILSDPITSKYVDGSAFHNYRGYMSSMSLVHLARPDKNIYFTEQMTTENPQSPTIDIAASVKRTIIDVMRNWSRNSILWNLAADPQNDPHTDNGGCSMCQGAITIDGDIVTRNIAFYTIAHASKFVRPGSKRVSSTSQYDPGVDMTEDEQQSEVHRATIVEHSDVLPNVAFKTPDGKIVLIVANNDWKRSYFKIQYHGRYANLQLSPGSVGTFIWNKD